jgi:AcrR family transcriptional regulator
MYSQSRRFRGPFPEPPAARRAQRRRTTADRIYRAALSLFRERGFEATRVEDIAQAAGVSKGTFFNYFRSKDAVLGHLGERQMQRLAAAIAGEPAYPEWPAPRQLAFILDTLAGGLEEEKALLRSFAFELYRTAHAFSETVSQARRLVDLLTEAVRRGQERGELRGDAPATSLALLIGAMYFNTFLAWLDAENTPALAELLRAHLQILLEGMSFRSPLPSGEG